MLTEYTDCSEFLRLISDQKIKPSTVKAYLKRQGMIFTATNPTVLAKDIYTILLGSNDMSNITQMIINEGNYEKSVMLNAKLRDSSNDLDIIDILTDGFNNLRSTRVNGYVIEQPIKNADTLFVQMSYKKKNL